MLPEELAEEEDMRLYVLSRRSVMMVTWQRSGLLKNISTQSASLISLKSGNVIDWIFAHNACSKFFFCKLMCLLLLVVVMLHLVQGYIILKLVYFIILTLISMTNIDTSLCFYVNIMFVWRHLWYCFSRTKIITSCL